MPRVGFEPTNAPNEQVKTVQTSGLQPEVRVPSGVREDILGVCKIEEKIVMTLRNQFQI
jgi:hypothetical protein